MGEYCHDNTPLTDSQRVLVIVAHYLTFVVCTYALWCVYSRIDVFRQRIYSPFLLLLGIVWLQIGPAFEIGNHFYVNDWELRDGTGDLVNASFSFFNFGAQNLNAIGLRKKDFPLLRRPDFSRGVWAGILDLVTLVADPLFLVVTVVQPIAYYALGRQASVSALSPVGGVAGIFTLFRLWRNLGPNAYTKWGGIGFFVLAMLGVIMLTVYRSSCVELVHLFIGGSFVASVIPFSVALANAELLPETQSIPTSKPEDIEGAGD